MNGRKQPVFDLGAVNVWFCRQCGCSGPVSFDRDETAYGLVEKIRAGHKRTSPGCESGKDHRIEIVNFERLKAKGRIA